ncbi:MAG: DUF1294 domain-containing protein [Pyrinomonadaceae bacterium]|nr:DUF1294 domain-containing protein [Phycisphaerales bacterium]
MPSFRVVALVYLVASTATFLTYGVDKWLAARRRRAGSRPVRVAEQTLHLMELLGGWPGALLGQQLFKHKRSKPPFMRVFWGIVALHVIGWVVVAVR